MSVYCYWLMCWYLLINKDVLDSRCPTRLVFFSVSYARARPYLFSKKPLKPFA